jgi:hypothetical protein
VGQRIPSDYPATFYYHWPGKCWNIQKSPGKVLQSGIVSLYVNSSQFFVVCRAENRFYAHYCHCINYNLFPRPFLNDSLYFYLLLMLVSCSKSLMIFTHGKGKVHLKQLFSMLFFFFWEIRSYRDIVTLPAKSIGAIVTRAKMADCTHSRKWLEVTWRAFISPFSTFNFFQACWCLSQGAVITLTPSGCKFHLQLLLTLVLDFDLMRVCFVQVHISTVTACMHGGPHVNHFPLSCAMF